MNLLSIYFWPFIFISLIPYYFFASKKQNIFLLFLSFIFLGITSLENLFVFLSVGITSYFLAFKLEHIKYKRSLLLIYCLFITTLVLIKRENFLQILGISYIGLTTIGYLLEIFWKRIKIVKNFSQYLLTILFYPLTSMGPILRVHHFQEQLKVFRKYDSTKITEGICRISLGFLKITTIANKLNLIITHQYPMTSELYGINLLAYCFFSYFMLYCEFSGYIDIAIGTAKLYGIKLPENFRTPYFSKSISEIWQRWHISLTSWLKDYVAFPLMLKYKSFILSTYVTILGVALWHGLKIHFLYWAIYWIFFYSLYVAYMKMGFAIKVKNNHLLSLTKIPITFLITILSTLTFLLEQMSFLDVLRNLFTNASWNLHDLTNKKYYYFIEIFICLFFIILLEKITTKKRATYLTILMIGFIYFLITSFGLFEAKELMYLNL